MLLIDLCNSRWLVDTTTSLSAYLIACAVTDQTHAVWMKLKLTSVQHALFLVDQKLNYIVGPVFQTRHSHPDVWFTVQEYSLW